MRARITLVTLLGAALLLAGGPAAAKASHGCEAIARVQTYEGWGPALHYGRTVTVAYALTDCSASLSTDGFAFEATGTATVFRGASAAGSPLTVEPFTASGAWGDPASSGWPPAWWSCDVARASISWEIPGAYTFLAGATGDRWTLEVQVPGHPAVHWSRAC
jgi:hypothetical protein